MNQTRMFIFVFGITGIFIVLMSGCSRSQGYKEDQPTYPQGYYSDGAGSNSQPSGRIEAMGQPKKKLAVLNFWNDTPVDGADFGFFAADELKRILSLTNRVVLPPDATSTLETKDFVQGSDIKVAQLIREAKRLGVAIVVIGRIGKIVFRQRGDEVGIFRQTQSLVAADVEVKVFDVNAGKEIAAIGRSAESSSNSFVAVEQGNLQSKEYRAELSQMAIREAVNQIAPELIKNVEKTAWQGRIAKIVGTRVYINSGRGSGLVSGDILKVLSPGDELYDPTTGAFLGQTQGLLKGTLEVKDFLGEDGAVSMIHTGGNFKEGDTVKLY